jgi:hypothetical protein
MHMHQLEKKIYIKDQFYNILEKTYEECPKFDIKICLGDFNAKIGKEIEARPYVGSHSLHVDDNNNGERLVNFATEYKMAITGTLFSHKIYTK